MSKYLIEYNKDISNEELEEKIRSIEGLPLSQMRVKDLVFHNDEPIYTANGVYVFKYGNEICYVGNCVARCFVERIPAHFDIRSTGWFHSLLTALIKKKYGKVKKTNDNLQEAAVKAFSDLSLVLINFPIYDKTAMNNLENILGNRLKPYNSRFRKLINTEIPI